MSSAKDRRILLLFAALTFLSSCESDKAKSERYRLMDEAYEVGVAIGLAELLDVAPNTLYACLKVRRPAVV
jgi:hypothetical protein